MSLPNFEDMRSAMDTQQSVIRQLKLQESELQDAGKLISKARKLAKRQNRLDQNAVRQAKLRAERALAEMRQREGIVQRLHDRDKAELESSAKLLSGNVDTAKSALRRQQEESLREAQDAASMKFFGMY